MDCTLMLLLTDRRRKKGLKADVTWGRPAQVPVWWKETHGAGSRSATSHSLYLTEGDRQSITLTTSCLSHNNAWNTTEKEQLWEFIGGNTCCLCLYLCLHLTCVSAPNPVKALLYRFVLFLILCCVSFIIFHCSWSFHYHVPQNEWP